MGKSTWQKIHDGVFMFQDSCRVYAVQCPEGTVIINAGTGLAADHLGEVVQNAPVTVFCLPIILGTIRMAQFGCMNLGQK